MPEFNLAIIISSFIAGALTFFAPCTLPLIPAFLGIISGAKVEDIRDPEKFKTIRWRIFKNAVFYCLGFSLVFILFGVSISFVSQVLGYQDWLQRIGGALIILFGLVLLGWLRWPSFNLSRLFRPVRSKTSIGTSADMPSASRTSNGITHVSLINSFLLGALFAIGWSPCVGPLLGSILLLASTSATVFQGTFLLVVFSAGLALPFLLTALLIGKAFLAFGKWGKFLEIVNKIAGIFLVALGFLLITGQFGFILGQFKSYFYQFYFFEVFINKFL